MSKRNEKRTAGFTLLEAIVVLGLVSVLIVVMGSLLQSFMSATRLSTNKQAALQGCSDTFELLGKDLGGAVELDWPNAGAPPDAFVSLQRIYPYDVYRFPLPNTAVPYSWPAPVYLNNLSVTSHWDQDNCLEYIAYYYDSSLQQLSRWSYFGSPVVVTTSTAATGLNGFTVNVSSDSKFANITVTTMPHNDTVLQSASKLVPLHLPPAGVIH